MANQWCINGTTLDTQRYSSPIPLIGLYIASGTSVCFLFILCDALKGLIHRKQWLPCGLFSLNSVTLTLLSIATKIPVDLTTPMPSVQDQLSKLCATAMICVSMGVFMPSVGTNSYSENMNNMIALTILVITVIVNICIQIATGVIFTFIVENVIILICMLAMLVVLWFGTTYISREEDVHTHDIRNRFRIDVASMMDRVENWYSYSCVHNPQLILCTESSGLSVAFLSTLCSAVLSQAAIRSIAFKKLHFCEGVSDYKWSMWMIVACQIIIVVVGTLITNFRFLGLPSHLNFGEIKNVSQFEHEYVRLHFLFANRNVKEIIVSTLKWYTRAAIAGLYVITTIVPLLLVSVCNVLYKRRDSPWKGKERQRWMQRIIRDDIDKWIDENKKNPPIHLIKLLSTHGQQQSLIDELPPIRGDTITTLLVVILVRVTTASIPLALCGSLIHALDEVFEIIYFVDKRINTGSFRDAWKQRLAKVWWMGRGISSQQLQQIESSSDSSIGTMDHAVWIAIKLVSMSSGDVAYTELVTISDFFQRQKQTCTSINELYTRIEQLFCALLHFFLAQLPRAILKEVEESPIQECEEKARFIIKLLCKLELVEDKVQWLFPEGSNITSLINIQISSTLEEVQTASVGDVSSTHNAEIGSPDIGPAESV